jgi:carbon monoxide dehydrogenase subunit G
VTSVEGERDFAAPPERVFAALTDPDVVAGAMPVLRSHRVIDADHWEAKVKPPFLFAPSVTIHFEVVERRPCEHAALLAHGHGAHVASRFDLTANNAGGTHMRWRTEIELTGLLGAFAGHALEPVAKRQAERVLERVAETIGG